MIERIPPDVRTFLAINEPLVYSALKFCNIITDDNSVRTWLWFAKEPGNSPVLILGKNRLSLSVEQYAATICHDFLHLFLSHHRTRLATCDLAKDYAVNSILNTKYKLPDAFVLPSKDGFPELESAEFYQKKIEEDLLLISEMDNSYPHALPYDNVENFLNTLVQDYETTFPDARLGECLEGKTTNDLKLLLAPDKNQPNWLHACNRFIESSDELTAKSSFSRYSRRFGQPHPGKTTYDPGKIAVIIDTSASNVENLAAIVASVCGLLDQTNLTIYQCDSQVKKIDTLKLDTKLENYEVVGLGGTDLSKAVERAAQDGCKKVVIFTDGRLTVFTVEVDVLWIVFNNPAFTTNRGTVIHV